jgi:nucleoside-diphosphate-sugar epimerase
MYLVMGITGKVGGATARHLLKQGKQVRALVAEAPSFLSSAKSSRHGSEKIAFAAAMSLPRWHKVWRCALKSL